VAMSIPTSFVKVMTWRFSPTRPRHIASHRSRPERPEMTWNRPQYCGGPPASRLPPVVRLGMRVMVLRSASSPDILVECDGELLECRVRREDLDSSRTRAMSSGRLAGGCPGARAAPELGVAVGLRVPAQGSREDAHDAGDLESGLSLKSRKRRTQRDLASGGR
jgi:hypothetical protein